MNKRILLVLTVSLSLLVGGLATCCDPLMAIRFASNHCEQSENENRPMPECCLSQVTEVKSPEGLVVPYYASDSIYLATTNSLETLASKGFVSDVRKMSSANPSLTHQICVLLI